MATAPTDLFGSFRKLRASVLSLISVRAELLGLELKEEQERLTRTLVLAGVAAIFLGLAMQLVAFLVVIVFWDTYRLHAIVGITGFYLLIALIAALRIRSLWRHRPAPFAATVDELRKDLEAMQRRDEP